MHCKGWGTKSYNRSLDCPPCLVLFKMADKISMSQQAKVTSQRYISNNVTLKKRTACILRPVPAIGWAPIITDLNIAETFAYTPPSHIYSVHTCIQNTFSSFSWLYQHLHTPNAWLTTELPSLWMNLASERLHVRLHSHERGWSLTKK